jgi:DNA-directed RNA polymerase
LLKNNLKSSDLENLYSAYIHTSINCLKKKEITELKLISAKLSELSLALDLKQILSLKIENQKFYFPFMFDFRGRLYFLSKISPTFNKAIRYALH